MYLEVLHGHQTQYAGELTAPLELGRVQPGEPLYVKQSRPEGDRLVVAAGEEILVSRHHVRLEPLPSGRLQIANVSANNTVKLLDGRGVKAGESLDVAVPTSLSLGDKTVRIRATSTPPPEGFALLESRSHLVPDAAAEGVLDRSTSPMPLNVLNDQASESLIKWLQAVITVLQSASQADDFFQTAARSITHLVGLDTGAVVLRDTACEGGWSLRAVVSSQEDKPGWQPSRHVLQSVCEHKQTLWQDPHNSRWITQSLAQIEAVVAAPILDRQGEVLGVLYGDRRRGSHGLVQPSISRTEALLVETLACGVAAGLSRQAQERATLEAQVRFAQFFTPELARTLIEQPQLLNGRDAEVTLLFCDIRGFSRISERLGPAGTVRWVGSVLGVLSDCVSRHSGVLVDYIGDALMAMWGSPATQPDHPQLACLAALDMLRAVPLLNQDWQHELHEEFRLGIGINTGLARVGNIGTTRKFKYGPLGNTVNLASRVQGATKFLHTDLIITAATQSRLGTEFLTRKLCWARVVNIAEPVELYELLLDQEPRSQEIRTRYEAALAEFEARNYQHAMQLLGQMLADYPDDGPALVLLSRAVQQMIHPTADFTLDWELPGK